MEQQGLVKSNAFNFVEESMQTLDGAIKYANTLLASKLCPKHFYELKKDSKDRLVPDYTKGKPEAVLIVLQHGKEVGMSISQSLQQIIPVNGLISIKGDGAKSLIFSSGRLEKNSWVERTTGNIASKDYRISITAKRSDNGEELTRSFSVADAMRAGLWITDAKLKGKDGYRHQYSPWYRYPERMIKYRALGFLARDLFPDVLMGMVTEEEAKDYPEDEGTAIIEKPDGTKLKIEQPTHKKERSQDMTNDTIKKIDKSGGSSGKGGDSPAHKLDVKRYEEKELLNMGPKIYNLANTLTYKRYKLSELIDALPARKSNKKYREAILAFQDEEAFKIWLKRNEIEIHEVEQTQGQDTEITGTNITGNEDIHPDAQNESLKTDEDVQKEKETKEFDKQFSGEEDKGGAEQDKAQEKSTTNKQGLEIPELEETGSREFEDIKFVYDALNDLGVDNNRWFSITKGHKFGEQFNNKENFCRRGTINEINELLNSL